jgi:hypothetical protein
MRNVVHFFGVNAWGNSPPGKASVPPEQRTDFPQRGHDWCCTLAIGPFAKVTSETDLCLGHGSLLNYRLFMVVDRMSRVCFLLDL